MTLKPMTYRMQCGNSSIVIWVASACNWNQSNPMKWSKYWPTLDTFHKPTNPLNYGECIRRFTILRFIFPTKIQSQNSFTATETMTRIHPYFLRTPIDANLVIDFTELLLVLLRDDSNSVRNNASDIVLSLIHTNQPDSDKINKGLRAKRFTFCWNSVWFLFDFGFDFVAVIPLVAEDYLLNWVSSVFIQLDGHNDYWRHWLELIKMIQMTASHANSDGNGDSDENNANADADLDIFEANDINMFGETVYITCKCYTHLMQSIDACGKSVEEKYTLRQQIHREFPMLPDF